MRKKVHSPSISLRFSYFIVIVCFFSQIFPIFDKNGDGTVDFSEFVLSCGLGSKNDLDSQLDLAFTL